VRKRIEMRREDTECRCVSVASQVHHTRKRDNAGHHHCTHEHTSLRIDTVPRERAGGEL
jgi:hypothetical protein